jgi:MOSC domain-containing protein YiiM
MLTLRDLMVPPGTGVVQAIVVRGASRAPAMFVPATRARTGIGLVDDRLGARGEAELSTRQVTLIQHEHLPVIAQLAGVEAADARALRRNLVIRGLNLLACRNLTIDVGEALLQIVGPCAPCSRMEEVIGPGGYAAMRGHGGMSPPSRLKGESPSAQREGSPACARVLRDGAIAVGARVRVVPAQAAEPPA